MPSTPSILLAFFTTSVLAQTSLFIPGFDPEPLSADILGVESSRTTWALHQGVPTGTSHVPDLLGTVTLVEGPHYASFTWSEPAGTADVACTWSSDLASCSGNVNGAAITDAGTVTRFAVQAGTTAPAVSIQTSQTSQTTQGTKNNTPPKPSGQTTSEPAPTHTSGARTLGSSLSYLFIPAVAVVLFIQV